MKVKTFLEEILVTDVYRLLNGGTFVNLSPSFNKDDVRSKVKKFIKTNNVTTKSLLS